ncbi:methyltransferase [Enterococcus sp.]|uniref:class I SAM-dependent methyltransferase n=1 Tax=Enterococcus sp. TaxID=35783 RepID=UPI00289B6F54|nr:methyltransferase [Enterococcus sp.]
MIEYSVSDHRVLKFFSNQDVFSPSNIDLGALAMLKQVQLKKGDLLLDLGCGYGFVGIYAAETVEEQNITMVDISKQAIDLDKKNALKNGYTKISIIQSDGLDDVNQNGFNWILSNPPYHVDFSVPKKFIYQSYEKLAIGGKLVMVTKRREWYKNKLISVFGGVTIYEVDGYFVFTAQKKAIEKENNKEVKRNRLSKKLARKNEIKKRRKSLG